MLTMLRGCRLPDDQKHTYPRLPAGSLRQPVLVSVLDLEQYRFPGRTGGPSLLGSAGDTDVVSL